MEMVNERLEDKLDKCTEAVAQLAVRLESYPQLLLDVADHEKRITALEALEVTKYSDRLAKVESAINTFRGWILGATAVALAVGGIFAWVLNNLADKLQ